MTGLEKMKSQILEEAKKTADQKIADAKAKASEITSQAEAEADKISEAITQKSDTQIAGYRERVLSSTDLQRRTRILAAKQEVIAQVLEKAYQSLTTMQEDEYFAMLLKMLDKYVLPEEGIIFFSAEDLGRMPAGFEAEVTAAAEKKGGKLVISKEGRKIENGFVLAYGGIEENCTLRAMFEAKKDELSDQVHRILFA